LPESGHRLRIVSFNVLGRNPSHEAVLDFLREQQADIVLLMEVQPAWAERLHELRNEYPHQHIVAREDNFGIALLSRSECRIKTLDLGPAKVPSLAATFHADERPLTFIGTHPVPPGSAAGAALRNGQLRELAVFVEEQTTPVILAGDLNVTSYSPYFHDLVRETGLSDTRQGIGIQASWSPPLPVLSLPLDHVLVSTDIGVLDRRIGPALGSDHRPVIVDLRIGP
jgi:endonuclease/exonuclease/phosphatase (EEP) superfamily protein YafD